MHPDHAGATFERMLELDFDTVIPGHSGVTDRANVEGYVDSGAPALMISSDAVEGGGSIGGRSKAAASGSCTPPPRR